MNVCETQMKEFGRMKMWKRAAVLLVTLVLSVSMSGGCRMKKKEGYTVVCTIYPIYDWVQTVLEGVDEVQPILLADKGVDMHSYQANADDIINIRESSLMVMVGGESENWVQDVLDSGSFGQKQTVVSLLELLGDRAKVEEVVEGMEHEHEEGNPLDELPGDDDHDHEDAEYDEHVWLSLRNAYFCVEELAEILTAELPEHKDVIFANKTAYQEKLAALDERYKALRAEAKYDTMIVGDRFPFRYLADDYDLKYYAAFAGCSAESEASFDTVIFLAQKMDELDVKCLLVIESSNRKLAKTIISNTKSSDCRILELDSLQSTIPGGGISYLGVMEKNLEVLSEALR